MVHQNLVDLGFDHFTSFPCYEKCLELDENGDQVEKFVPISPDDMRSHRSSSIFSDALNGTMLADTSHFDKFQLMDALEFAIDSMSEEEIETLKGKITNE